MIDNKNKFNEGTIFDKNKNVRWICSSDTSKDSVILRKNFAVESGVKSAKVCITGVGYFELYINNRKVGDEVLSPPFTSYDKRVIYSEYEITEYLSVGENAIAIILGNGFYNVDSRNSWNFQCAHWRSNPKAVMCAVIELLDKNTLCLQTDSSWKDLPSPIIYNNIYCGETYDARLELEGFSSAGFDDGEYPNARICSSPGGELVLMDMDPCRVTEQFAPASIKAIDDFYIVDSGINFAGWARISVKGNAGDKISLTYSERLDAKGDIDQTLISQHVENAFFQQDSYICKGTGFEEYQPRFTYHGFQYIKIEGLKYKPALEDIVLCRVNTDLKKAGSFECSNPLLNKIQELCINSTLSNYHGIPTDCPHREKNGWTGDAHLSAEQAIMNFDMGNNYAKWLADIRDSQRISGQLPGIVPTSNWGYNWGSGPAWDSALILIPWYLYVYCGRRDVLEDNYYSMKKYIDFMSSMANDNIVDFGLGDWCPPVENSWENRAATRVTDTGYYYSDVVIVSKVAGILGRKNEETEYLTLSENIRESFLNTLMDVQTGMVESDCQTVYAAAIYFGLVEGELKDKVFDRLVDKISQKQNHHDCGILGIKYLLQVLTDNGRTDIAYEIATCEDFPSWGDWIRQGATSLWESWDGSASLNHHMFSDISRWFYNALAGIRSDENSPGFQNVIIRPHPVGDLKFASASHTSPFGEISVQWKYDNNIFTLDVNIPKGCTGEVHNPFTDEIKRIGEGEYHFVSEK